MRGLLCVYCFNTGDSLFCDLLTFALFVVDYASCFRCFIFSGCLICLWLCYVGATFVYVGHLVVVGVV